MITFTKEQLIASAHARIEFAEMMLAGELEPLKERTWSIELELARIALASLEAEPVAYIRDGFRADGVHFFGGIITAEEHERTKPALSDRYNWKHQPLYAAPPVPVSVTYIKWPEEKFCPAEYAGSQLWEETEIWNKAIDACKAACRAAMLQGAEPVTTTNKLPEETGSSLQLRNLIRQRHAEWSQATFGDVGPVGPLKHLSKEALEAAEEPDDLSEWADMQFLLWDAQRRAGISDGEITAAMEEKLKVNMARQWPEPKDGEPRLHIKAAPQQEVK